jgi:molybdopterin synthase catalytic subunit
MFFRAIEDSDRESLRFHIKDEVLAHDGQPDQPNITLIRAHFGISFEEADPAWQFSGHGELMANPVCEVFLTEAPLDAGRASIDDLAIDVECGAIVEFRGVVRRLEQDRAIEGIEYETHAAMATHQMELIAQAALQKFGLRLVVLHHRFGFFAAGDASLWLRVATGHRGAALSATAWIVDELKQRVPIWKRPRFVNEEVESPSLSQEMTAVSSRQ